MVLDLSLGCWQGFRVSKIDSPALEPILPNLSLNSDPSFPSLSFPHAALWCSTDPSFFDKIAPPMSTENSNSTRATAKTNIY